MPSSWALLRTTLPDDAAWRASRSASCDTVCGKLYLPPPATDETSDHDGATCSTSSSERPCLLRWCATLNTSACNGLTQSSARSAFAVGDVSGSSDGKS